MHESTAPVETIGDAEGSAATEATEADEATRTARPATLETLPPPGPQQQPHALAAPTAPTTQPLPSSQATSPSHPAPPHAPQPRGAHAASPPVAYPASYQPWAHPMPQTTSRPGLVLGVISLIASGLALLGVIGLAFWTLAGQTGGLPADDFGSPPAPLTGQLPSVPNGKKVSSEDLTDEITQRLVDDGWYVEDMRCPQVTGVGPGTVSVCHGTMDDSEWAVIVFFEDARGSYTLSLV